MGGDLESNCVGRVNGAPYTRPTQQKTICCNSKSNAPDDGRMYPKRVELGIYQ